MDKYLVCILTLVLAITDIAADPITRLHDEMEIQSPPPLPVAHDLYPWEIGQVKNLPRINKEFFRCKGCVSNPDRVIEKEEELAVIKDCKGHEKHGLPLHDGEEFIYPILVDLLNHVQEKTGKRVIITSGHRCPEHNTYVDSSKQNRYSKHQIGAEVTFYVQGMEATPESVIALLHEYYRNHPDYEYQQFKRYTKDDTNVSNHPWYNKEIFVKLFLKNEGRNFDNRHSYPYIGIQVKFNFEKGERVYYSWDKAHRHYLRKT